MLHRSLLLGLLACSLSVATHAQRSLADIVDEAKVGAMIGTWAAQTDEGQSFTIAFAWDLDKHVINLTCKTPDSDLKGYTSVDPTSNEVTYVGFDNHGTVTKGSWTKEGDDIVLRFESRSADRGPVKMAAVFSPKSEKEFELRLQGVSDSGDLVSPARTVLKFKKK